MSTKRSISFIILILPIWALLTPDRHQQSHFLNYLLDFNITEPQLSKKHFLGFSTMMLSKDQQSTLCLPILTWVCRCPEQWELPRFETVLAPLAPGVHSFASAWGALVVILCCLRSPTLAARMLPQGIAGGSYAFHPISFNPLFYLKTSRIYRLFCVNLYQVVKDDIQ